mgnify:CR=1 FL=1
MVIATDNDNRYTLTLSDIPITVIRKRVRTLRLHVRPDGSVWMTTPQRTPKAQAAAFAESKQHWLEKARARILAARTASATLSPQSLAAQLGLTAADCGLPPEAGDQDECRERDVAEDASDKRTTGGNRAHNAGSNAVNDTSSANGDNTRTANSNARNADNSANGDNTHNASSNAVNADSSARGANARTANSNALNADTGANGGSTRNTGSNALNANNGSNGANAHNTNSNAVNADNSARGANARTANTPRYSKRWKLAALAYFREAVARFLPCFADQPIPVPIVKGRAMKSLWGSCNRRTNTVTLNWALLKASARCVDYVVLHELTHFLYFHHDKQFYSYLARYMSDYKSRIRELNQQTPR